MPRASHGETGAELRCRGSRVGCALAALLAAAGPAWAAEAVGTPDGTRTLLSKDVGVERWAITHNFDEDGTVTGNVFFPGGGDPQFLWCEDHTSGAENLVFQCFGARGCEAACTPSDWSWVAEVPIPATFFKPSGQVTWVDLGEVAVPRSFFAPDGGGRGSGVQATPDEKHVLVNKDVGGARWAIAHNLVDGTVTGNVFSPAGGSSDFLYCETVAAGEEDTVLSCAIASASSCVGDPCGPAPFKAGDLILASEAGVMRVELPEGRLSRLGQPFAFGLPVAVAVAGTHELYALVEDYDPARPFPGELSVVRMSDFNSAEVDCSRCRAELVTNGGELLDSSPAGLVIDGSGALIVGLNGFGPSGSARIVRIDPATGAQAVVAHGFVDSLTDIDVDEHGRLIALGRVFPASGPNGVLVRIDLSTGEYEVVASGDHFAAGQTTTYPSDLGVSPDGTILVSLDNFDDVPRSIVRVDPLSGLQVLVSPGVDSRVSGDIAVGLDGTWYWGDWALYRFDPGTQEVDLVTYIRGARSIAVVRTTDP